MGIIINKRNLWFLFYGGKTVSFQIQIKESEKSVKYNSKNVKVLTNKEVKNTKDNKHDDPLLLELIITLVLMLAYLIFKKVGIKEKLWQLM